MKTSLILWKEADLHATFGGDRGGYHLPYTSDYEEVNVLLFILELVNNPVYLHNYN